MVACAALRQWERQFPRCSRAQIRITKASRTARKALLSDPLPGPGAERRVYVGRPSVLGNPTQIGRDGSSFSSSRLIPPSAGHWRSCWSRPAAGPCRCSAGATRWPATRR